MMEKLTIADLTGLHDFYNKKMFYCEADDEFIFEQRLILIEEELSKRGNNIFVKQNG